MVTIRLSVCGPHGTIRLPLEGFVWNFVFGYFFKKKTVDKVQVSLKSDKNNGCFTRGAVYALKISRSILLSIKNICGKLCGENQTHIFCSVTFPENYAIHEIM